MKIQKYFTALYLAGVVSFFYYPDQLARRTYVSENALMPGTAQVDYGERAFQNAVSFSNSFSDLVGKKKDTNDSREISDLLLDQLLSRGFECYPHDFTSVKNHQQFRNVYCIVRATKAAGTESLLISTQIDTTHSSNPHQFQNQANGLGLWFSLIENFQTSSVRWLAKDVLFLASSSQESEQGVYAFLNDYLLSTKNSIVRSGKIQAAINLDLGFSSGFDFLNVKLESLNGQLPNLDLLNAMVRCVHNDLVRLEELEIPSSFIPKQIQQTYFTPGLKILLNFMKNQALGVPTGQHGLFNYFRIDALTLSNKKQQSTHGISSFSVAGRIVEGTIRSLNNLIEHLHQSFYYYLLSGHLNYIPIGDYMISLGLIIVGFFLQILITVLTMKYDSKSMYFICVVLASQLCGILVFSVPFVCKEIFKLEFLSQHSTLIASQFPMICLGVSTFIVFLTWFVIFRRIDRTTFAKNVSAFDSSFKGIACLPALMFLSGFSLLNFSFVVCVSALLVVPFYTVISPAKSIIFKFIQLVLLALISPLSLLSLWSFVQQTLTTQTLSLSNMNEINPLLVYSQFFEQYVNYGNLWFVFGTLIYLPLNLSYTKMIFGK